MIPDPLSLRALVRQLGADGVREALHRAVDEAVDAAAAERTRRAPVRPPPAPALPVDEIARETARRALQRAGVR